jgi:hypothetical protein
MTATAVRLPGRPLFRILLTLAALDSFAWGGWAVLRPADLFAWLHTTPPADVVLWQLLGLLTIMQSCCLLAVVARPEGLGTLVLVPLVGRLLAAGTWLWLLGADRVHLPATALHALALHDGLWVPLFAGFFLAWLVFTSRRSACSSARCS